MNKRFGSAAVFVVAATMTFSVYAASDWATGSGSCFGRGVSTLNLGGTFWLGVGVSYEYGIHDAISLGGGTGYYLIPRSDWIDHYLPICARASFHPFNLSVLADKISVRDKLDVYGGLSVGVAPNFQSGNATRENDHRSIHREHIGVRYYFANGLAAYAEEGSGFDFLNAGITLKF